MGLARSRRARLARIFAYHSSRKSLSLSKGVCPHLQCLVIAAMAGRSFLASSALKRVQNAAKVSGVGFACACAIKADDDSRDNVAMMITIRPAILHFAIAIVNLLPTWSDLTASNARVKPHDLFGISRQ